MKIGIIGSGNVGGTLGKAWSRLGHEVIFGFRSPDETQARVLLNEAAASSRAASVKEAVKAGEVIVLATPWTQRRMRWPGPERPQASELNRSLARRWPPPLL